MLLQIPDILLSVTAVTNLGLMWFVYRRDRDKTVNRIFALFVAFITFWAIVILLFRLVDSAAVALYLMKLSYISALFLALFFYQFSYLFPDSKGMSRAHRAIAIASVSALSLYILLPHSLTLHIVSHEWGKEVLLEPFGYLLFAAAFLYLFLSGQIRLLLKVRGSSGSTRTQLWIISTTVIAVGAFGMYYNLLLPSPWLQDFRYIWSGPVFTFAFAVMITYSIFRFRLLSPRAILAELLVYTLLLFLFVRVILTDASLELVINGALLLAVAAVGVFLVRGVTREVEQREEIETLSEEKSEFMTFASHEIRNPITAMRGYASLIVDGTAGDTSKETRDAAEKILVTGNEVLTLIGQFLSKSKMELGQISYTMQPFDLGAAIHAVAGGYAPHAEQKNLTLSVEIPPEQLMVKADEGKVKEVIGNIIDNSLKYTKTGGITVSVGNIDGVIRVSVADTGVGIPPETLPRLFQKFSRADAAKAILLGTGVGLYLAKTFIDAMGGNIWAESDGKGKGSRFIIEFPAV